jgi:hypothetical protein
VPDGQTGLPTNTPPFVEPSSAPAPMAGGSSPDAQTQELLKRVLQPRTQLPMPKPPSGERSAMDTKRATTHAEGNQMFFHNLGALVNNAVQDHKEKQTQKATATMQTLNSAWQDAQDLANGDPAAAKAAFAKMPQVNAILTDPKQMKELAKLMSFDAMNPEKNKTVYHEAAARVGKANVIQQKMKGIREALSLHKQQQELKPPEELAQDITSRGQRQAPDVKGATEVMTAQAHLKTAEADLEKAQAATKDTYSAPVVTKSGEVVVYDKKDPNKTVTLHGEDGKPVQGMGKPGAAPKVAMVENVPYGVARNGQVVTPDSKDWTADDATMFNAAKAAAATGEANKAKLADKRETFFSSLPQAVLLKQDDPQKGVKAGELAFVTRKEAGGNPAKYAPVAAGDKTMGTQARFGEIQATVDMTNTAIKNLPDTGFDAATRAQIAYVLRAPDPASALDGFFKSDVAKTLSDAQIDYVTSLASMAESAQALTSLQGIGARGSDKLRAAITAMLPGSGTPSRKYAETQMKKFQVELDSLRKGVPSVGDLDKRTGSNVAPTGITSFTDGGITYDIPRDKLPAFKKAHPNARTAN